MVEKQDAHSSQNFGIQTVAIRKTYRQIRPISKGLLQKPNKMFDSLCFKILKPEDQSK